LSPSLRSINTSSDGLEERAVSSIGLRLPLDFDPAVFRTAIDEWASSWPNGVVNVAYRGYEPTWRGDSKNSLVRSFLAAIRSQQIAGARPAFLVKTGTSDMNVVGPVWRCPILAYGPGDSRLDHTPIEHVELDEYWRAVLVLERALRSVGDELAAERHSAAG
jgi:LysW-gamma-L-lysine carboxypeptidase